MRKVNMIRHAYILLASAYNFFVKSCTETFKGKKRRDGFRESLPGDYIA
jgi:hypothetical protein